MLSGKTKQGVSIKSTYGMRPLIDHEIWMLVADRSRIRLFKKRNDELGTSIDLMFDSPNPEGRKKGRELVSDRPGRCFDSQDSTEHGQTGGARHSYGNRFSAEDSVTEKLVRQTADYLRDLRWRAGTELVLVAEPRLMGLLRNALTQATPQVDIECHEKDFAWLDNDELELRLRALIE